MLSWFFGKEPEPKKNRPTDAEIHQMVIAAFHSVAQKHINTIPSHYTLIDITNDIMKTLMSNNPHVMSKGDLVKTTKLCRKYAEQVIRGKLIQILIALFLIL